MEIQVTGKNLELTPAVRSYVTRKLDKVNRHLPNIMGFDVEITQERTRSPNQRFVVQVTVNSNGTLLRGEERGEDLYSAIDKVAEVMNRQVEHFKGKLYAKGRGGVTIRNVAAAEAAEPAAAEEAEPTGEKPRIVRVKKFNIKPMSVEEAADQMSLLGHDFFLFTNSDSNGLNLLYRRKDGDFGLIQPAVTK